MPCYQLNSKRDGLSVRIALHQQMNIIGGNRIVQKFQRKLAGFEQPRHESEPVRSKLQQKFLFMATVSYVLNAAWRVVPIVYCNAPSSLARQKISKNDNPDFAVKNRPIDEF